jgi:hypothetical protein
MSDHTENHLQHKEQHTMDKQYRGTKEHFLISGTTAG